MTFPIKKRINTELFIYSNTGLYIQKGDKGSDLLEVGRTEMAGKSKAGMKAR